MKFVLVLVALVGLSVAAPQPKGLKEDFLDIIGILPVEDIRALARKYLNTDAEFQQIVAYLQGPEWAGLVDDVRELESYQAFKAYLINAGIDVDKVIQWIHDLIAGAHPEGKSVRGVREFLDELHELIPTTELIAMITDKLENSAAFQDLYVTISTKGQGLFEEVRAMDEVVRIADILRGWGVKVDEALEMIYLVFGWN